jgi:predicted  nucleic acid-binding Zn-ribbon protein
MNIKEINREIAFLKKIIEKQGNYLKYLKSTYRATKKDIAEKEARLEELRREVRNG